MIPPAGGPGPAAFEFSPLAPDRTTGDRIWERMWAPYDPPTYNLVLACITPHDTIYEIGAGDLRLARQMAAIARQVYAIEIDAGVLAQDKGFRPGRAPADALPANLAVICGDALAYPPPPGVTAGVLLMRHCTHFGEYARRLRAAGCSRLITNARWRMGVEEVLLQSHRPAFARIPHGWYACLCGATGFKPGPLEDWTPEQDAIVHEVCDCPECEVKKMHGATDD